MVVGLVVFVSFRTNEEGYPFETSTDDKCFFSSEIAAGFDVRCLARSYGHLTIQYHVSLTGDGVNHRLGIGQCGWTSNSRNNNEDRNAPIAANQHATNSDT